MKNAIKLVGIVTFIALIGFLSVACDNGGDSNIDVTHPLIEDMVWVTGGSFQMGNSNTSDYENPVHTVTLTGFYIGKYPVTQKQYQAVMGKNPSSFHGWPIIGAWKRPVETVSWYDAIVFCNKLSMAEGLSPAYSLDGETDPDKWDFSIRTVGRSNIMFFPKWNIPHCTVTFETMGSGSPAPEPQDLIKGTKVVEPPIMSREGYSFGGWYKDSECTDPWIFSTDIIGYDDTKITLYAKWISVEIVDGSTGYRLPTEAQWEYAAKGGSGSPGNYMYAGSDTIDDVAWYKGKKTHEVGKKKANGLGLYDMSGNVWEWCWDWYDDYGDEAQTDPTGAVSGTSRVRRGGGWGVSAEEVYLAYRGSSSPSLQGLNLGFRLVRP